MWFYISSALFNLPREHTYTFMYISMLTELLFFLFQPRRSIPKSLKYPTLAFTKYADTIPDTEKQPKAHHENVFRKVPGIGTYTLGTKTTKSYDKGEQDMRRELSDIRKHEIPKNHNTPINEREFTWEREQKRLILQDQEARKDARHLQRPSKSQDGVRNIAK